MKIKKAFVFGETKGFSKTFEQNNSKPYPVARQRLAKSEVRHAT